MQFQNQKQVFYRWLYKSGLLKIALFSTEFHDVSFSIKKSLFEKRYLASLGRYQINHCQLYEYKLCKKNQIKLQDM